MSVCSSQPISWLALEQYHLGELSPKAADHVNQHLETCAACAGCLRAIEEDARTLPVLPDVTKESIFDRVAGRRILHLTTALAAAMILAILVYTFVFYEQKPPETFSDAPSGIGIKGADSILTVVRERGGRIVENPAEYLDGDRFKLLVTQSGLGETEWDVVVFQGDEVFFPYTPQDLLPRGNRVPVPGAFRLTGDLDTEICIVLGDEIPARSSLATFSREDLPPQSVCVAIRPVRQ